MDQATPARAGAAVTHPLAEIVGLDGRTLPPAPMPPVLAALTDPAKADPGPHDTPDELATRLATPAEIRRERPPGADAAVTPAKAVYARRHRRVRLAPPTAAQTRAATPWYVRVALGQPSTPPWRTR